MNRLKRSRSRDDSPVTLSTGDFRAPMGRTIWKTNISFSERWSKTTYFSWLTSRVQQRHNTIYTFTVILLNYYFVFVWRRTSFDADQRAISTWLRRCDEERDKSLKCGIIKLMLVSLQHPSGNMKLFRHSAPKNLPYLINTPNYVSTNIRISTPNTCIIQWSLHLYEHFIRTVRQNSKSTIRRKDDL